MVEHKEVSDVGYDRQVIGAWGETTARNRLASLGYRILKSNVRYRRGELDLICEQDLESGESELVFVEVRVVNRAFVPAEYVLGLKKQMALRRSVNRFLAKYSGRARSARIDFLVCYQNQWRHFTNIMNGVD